MKDEREESRFSSFILHPPSFHSRLIIDPPAAGAWNMAVDEVLLESAAQEGRLTLRFYRWSEPTLSLGYFQRYEDRRLHPASVACVRRSTGGGAILHDRELTYSIAVPPTHPLARSAPRLYQAMHGSLVECLRQFGFDAFVTETRARRADPGAPGLAEPFLCFDRRATGDVVVGPHKIVGSAQRRWHGAVLQHGSILLAASPAAPKLPGLNDIAGAQLTCEDLVTPWRQLLPRILDADFLGKELTAAEHLRAGHIVSSKYGHSSWTQRR